METIEKKDAQMSDMSENQKKTGIQVISRAAHILRVLRESQSEMSLGQIALKTELHRSTVQRIIAALVEERFVINHHQGRGFRLGPEFNSFAGAAQYGIVEHCRLFLTELTQKTGETADLSVMRGIGMTFLDQVPGTHRLTTMSKVDEVFPLSTTANGRCCLALLPEKDAVKLVQAEWQRNGSHGDMTTLLGCLTKIRETGLAYDIDQHTVGICAVGFAFRDWSGTPHAISIPLPTTRFEQMKPLIEAALIETQKGLLATLKT